MAGLELEFMVPTAELQPFVTLFYRFHCPHDFDDLERAGIAQFRFRLSAGPACYHFCDGSVQDAPPFHLVGPTTGTTRTCADGPVQVFGMGLSPAGWAVLVGADASSHADRCADAAALCGDEVAELAAALREAGDGAAMIAAVEPWLQRRLAGGHDELLDFVRAVDAWLVSAPSPAIEELATALGLSRRQVERRCNVIYGAPPKLLARKVRALRAAVAMASGEVGAVAEVEGFYDQSHLIREVKHFTGLTPKRMRDEPGALAYLTITQRRELEGRVGPLISDT